MLQGGPQWGHLNSPLTLTVFVNGTPLNTFLGKNREVVITPLLKERKNEFKIVSARVKDAIDDNDIQVQMIGPLHYNASREKFEGKPIVEFSCMQSDHTSGASLPASTCPTHVALAILRFAPHQSEQRSKIGADHVGPASRRRPTRHPALGCRREEPRFW